MEPSLNSQILSSLLELSSEMMAVLSEDGRFLHSNPPWEKTMGYSELELSNTPFFELIHPDDIARTQEHIHRLREREPRVTLENRLRNKQGLYSWWRWTIAYAPEDRQFFLVGRDVSDFKLAEESLQETQAKFQRLSDSSNEGVAIHEKGVILQANQALARMFGFDQAEDMVGKNGLDLTAPEYRQVILNNILRAYEEPYEVVGLRKDGTRFDCLLSGKPILYQGRSVRVSTFLDITALKKREQELFESQELFRKLAEASQDGIAVSEKGKILVANPALARMFGCEITEMVGRNAVEFTAPEFRETLLKKVLEEVETKYEVMGLRRDGSRFPVEITPRMTTYQGRRVRVAFFRDISQRKRIEEEIHRQKEFNQNLINSSIDGLMAFDRECHYTLWNPAMERLTGHSREEVLGKCAFDVFPFLKHIGQDHYFYQALEGKTVVSKDRPFRTPAGKQGFFESVYSPLKNTRGEIIGGLGIIHDVTERKKMEESLHQSQSNLRAVFQNTFQNIILMNREGRIQTYNENAADAFWAPDGHGLEAGRNLMDYLPPALGRDFSVHLKKSLQGEAVQFERQVLLEEDGEQWLEVAYNPVFGDGGDIEGVCLTTINIDERKDIAAALQKSEADLRSVFNSGHQAIILAGPDGAIRDFNPNAERYLEEFRGQKLELGRNLAEYVETEYVQAYLERFQKVLQGEVVHLERTVRSVEGGDYWFEFNYNPVFDGQGRVVGVCVSVASIDKRKKAEEALQKSEADLRTLFNSVQQNIILMDSQRKIQNFNQAAQETFRRALGLEIQIGKDFLDYVRPEDQDKAQERLAQALQGKQVRVERPYRFADGTQHWLEYIYHPVLNSKSQIQGVCFTSQSIDERKASEQALRESEEKFRKIFEDASVGMTLVDKNFRFLHVNQAFCDFVGYTAEELSHKTFRDITYPEDLPRNMELAQNITVGKGFHMQKRYRHKDGSIVWGNLTVTSLVDEKAEALYSVGMVEDITDQKRSEQLLQESEEKFRRIFEDAPTAMAMVNDYKFLKVNRAFQELLGYSPREIEGKTLFEITHPDDLPKTKDIAAKLHQGEKEQFRTEKRYLRKDGQGLWANVSGTLIRDGAGNKLYSLIMIEDISERKKAQEALRKSERDLKAVFNSGSQVMVLIGRDGRIQGFNKSASILAPRVLGKEIEIGMLFADTLPPGASLKVFQDSFAAALTGKETKGERAIRSSEGKERWVEVNYQPVFNEEGRVEEVCFSLTFIDERKKAEKDLLESQERFQRLVQLTQEGVLIHENPTLVDANPALATMMGYEPEEMIGKSGFDFLAPESHETARRNMMDKSPRPYEALALRKDGSTFPVELQGRNLQYKGKEIRVLSVRDLTWRKEAERILTESENRYRRLVELSPEAVVVHSGGKVLYVNPAGLEMFNMPGGKVEGISLLDFLDPEDRDLALKRVQQIMETGKPTDWTEMRLLRTGGGEFYAETKGTPFLFQGIPAVLTIVRDISERKKSHQTLLRYERLAAVGKVIAAIAHEIRNPLAVLAGMSQALKMRFAGKPEFAEEVDTILMQAERLRLFMTDILDYSRELLIKKTEMNLRDTVEKSLRLVQSQVDPLKASVTVKWDWDRKLPMLWADGERLEQIFVNLILNAYQSMGPKGKLTLSGHQQEGWILLGVKDDGPGVSEGDLPRLFEPFFTTKKHGSGLGLPISQKIVEAHGGKIEVKRIQPHGTQFTVQLPAPQK